MKTLLSCIFPLFLSFNLFAQNLLLNPGFEDENICLEYEKNCAPEGWISTSLYADYYFDDKPHAFEGRHFVGLVLSEKERPQTQNFLRTKLLCGLRKGAQYKLELYLRSPHDVFDSIGVYFSSTDFLYQKDRLSAAHPQLFVQKDSTVKLADGWRKVSILYTATGDEVFLNIGDFARRGHALYGVPDLGRAYYFFLDAISLTPLNPAEKLCDDAEKVKDEEYAFDVRHGKLDRLIYTYTKGTPPAVEPPSKTIVQRIDTLVIPDVLFATASYALNTTANAVLDSFIRASRTVKVDSVVVEGHTDNQGSLALNGPLSENRASAVAGYLQPHFRKAIITRGWASNKPVADNRTPAGRQKNRRVEIYFYVRE